MLDFDEKRRFVGETALEFAGRAIVFAAYWAMLPASPIASGFLGCASMYSWAAAIWAARWFLMQPPEQALELWREGQETAQAIREGLADVEAVASALGGPRRRKIW